MVRNIRIWPHDKRQAESGSNGLGKLVVNFKGGLS